METSTQSDDIEPTKHEHVWHGKWGDYDVELMEGNLGEWEFVEDHEPWLCPSVNGLQVCVTDWSCNSDAEWDYIIVALRAEDMLPRMLEAHVEDEDGVKAAIASAESLERMAAKIRAHVAEIVNQKAQCSS